MSGTGSCEVGYTAHDLERPSSEASGEEDWMVRTFTTSANVGVQVWRYSERFIQQTFHTTFTNHNNLASKRTLI